MISKTDQKSVKDVLQKIVSDKSELLKSDPEKMPNKTDVKALVNQLLKELSSGVKAKENILQDVKYNDIPKLMKNATSELKVLLGLLKTDKSFSKLASSLEKLLPNIKDIKPETFKKELSKSGIFMESKLSLKKSQTMPVELKEVLNNIKNILLKLSPKKPLHVELLDTLLKTEKLDKTFIQNLKNLVVELKKPIAMPKQMEQLLAKLDSFISQKTSENHLSIQKALADIKQLVSKAPKEGMALHVELVEKILDAPKADKSFIDDIKNLIKDLRQNNNISKAVVEVAAKLEELVQKSELLESKMKNASAVTPKEISKVATEIKQVLVAAKTLVQTPKKEPILEAKAQEIVKLVEQTLKTPEFFPKDLKGASISEKLQQVVNIIKSELVKVDVKSDLHVEVSKLANKLESVIKEHVSTKQIVPNQNLKVDVPIKQELINDMKSILLSIKHELSTQNTPIAREILLHVDRLVTQVEYFQLLSLGTNSQTSYLPFLWDGLEEGQVSLKKLKENRFFCEINLKLKEYGKIDLMLMLFDDIHLNISVFAEKEEFLNLFRENLSFLKQGINKLGLISANVQIKKADLKEENNSSNIGLGEGLNLKI